MNKKVVVRATKPYKSARSALLRLFSVNEEGHEILAATSVCRLLEEPSTITPSIRRSGRRHASMLAARYENHSGRTGDDYLVT